MSSAKYRKQRNLDEFVSRYGGIYEHSSWVAEESFVAAGSVEDFHELAAIFANCVDRADHERKLALIRAHPDLAGKAAMSGEFVEIIEESDSKDIVPLDAQSASDRE